MHTGKPAGWKPDLVFFSITFGFSWGMAALIWHLGGLANPTAKLLLFVYMFGPMLGALAATFLFQPKNWNLALGFVSLPRFGWFWAVIIPALLVVVTTILDLLLSPAHWIGMENGLRTMLAAQGMTEFPNAKLPFTLQQIALLQWLVQIPLGIAINGVVLLTEELGWRGWLFHSWRKRMGFWRTSLVVGAIWGVWHAPIIVMGYNYPGLTVLGPLLMIGFCTLLSPWLFFVREKFGNVFAASFFHGTLNALAGVGLLVTGFPDLPWRGVVGFSGFLVLAAGLVVLFARYQPDRQVNAPSHS